MAPSSWCPGGPRWRPQTELAGGLGLVMEVSLHSLLIKVLPNREAQKELSSVDQEGPQWETWHLEGPRCVQ